ncbi:hypothetical protein ACIOEW_31335 [Streptomyces sp. NPDC087901]|uniref:hypothetical protein n=1 Tax=Streptomyces sp. NPDC087901 TaxID=3365818 RepID=UPI0037FBCA84
MCGSAGGCSIRTWSARPPRADAVHGAVAVERGPLVFCPEQTGPDGGVLDDFVRDTEVPPIRLGQSREGQIARVDPRRASTRLGSRRRGGSRRLRAGGARC